MHATPPSPSSVDAETLFVQREFLALTRSQWQASTLAVIGVSVVQAGIAYDHVPTPYLLCWLLLVLLGQRLRVAIIARPLLEDDPAAILQRVKHYVAIAPFCSAMSGLYFLSFPYLSDAARSVVSLLVLGQILGFISNGAGQRRLFFLYSIPLLLPLSLAWMLSPGNGYSAAIGVGVGLLTLVGMTGLLYGLADRVWHLFDSSCRIRFRESALNARLRLALSAAEQANQAKTRFLAAASHDLRQPLHVIGMISAALSLRTLDPTTQGMVKVLGQVNTSLSSLLDSLLDISKLDAGLVAIKEQVVPVDKLMQRVFNELVPLIEAKGLQAELHAQTGAYVRTDPILLVRILNNLSQNALKFTERGKISLRARTDGQFVVLEVVDTGCGIAPEHQDTVFQEFFQVGNSQRDPTSGLGLGLSIVRRLSLLLGLKIGLHSTLGEGTRVQLSIPLQRQQEEPGLPLPQPGPVLQARNFGLKILVVDDEVSILQASSLLLTELGCDCRTAENLEGASQQVSGWTPDVIITDLRLKGPLNGVETIAVLRGKLGPVTALLMSGDTAPDRLKLAENAGIRLCHKPISLDKLVQELDALTRQAVPGPR